jgi:ATP sulfurylase
MEDLGQGDEAEISEFTEQLMQRGQVRQALTILCGNFAQLEGFMRRRELLLSACWIY